MKEIFITIFILSVIYWISCLVDYTQEKANKDLCKILKSKNDISYYEICK